MFGNPAAQGSVLEVHSGAPANTYRHLAREVAIAAGETAVEPFKEARAGIFEVVSRLWRSLTARGHGPAVEPERTLVGAA